MGLPGRLALVPSKVPFCFLGRPGALLAEPALVMPTLSWNLEIPGGGKKNSYELRKESFKPQKQNRKQNPGVQDSRRWFLPTSDSTSPSRRRWAGVLGGQGFSLGGRDTAPGHSTAGAGLAPHTFLPHVRNDTVWKRGAGRAGSCRRLRGESLSQAPCPGASGMCL